MHLMMLLVNQIVIFVNKYKKLNLLKLVSPSVAAKEHVKY